MKLTLTILTLIFFFWACSDNSTNSNDNDQVDVQTFQSANVKTEGMQYFSFSSNSGSTTEPAEWDMAFSVIPFPVEIAPCQYLTIPDPAIVCNDASMIAMVEAASLADVMDIPATGAFKHDIKEGSPFIGSGWYDQAFNVKTDVYAIRSCGGGIALLDIKRYDYDFINHQITNIVWEYKYNADGSTDFSASNIDSFATGNANEEAKYFSFAQGVVTADDAYDVKVDGTSLWLGHNVMVKKMENMELSALTSITDDNFDTDVTPEYNTAGWYDYGEGHLLTPKDMIYVLKTSAGNYAAFEIVNYYDSEGNSGTFTINWKYME